MPEIRFYVDEADKKLLDNIKFDMRSKSWNDLFLKLAKESRRGFENIKIDMVINVLFKKYNNDIKKIIEKVIKEDFLKNDDK